MPRYATVDPMNEVVNVPIMVEATRAAVEKVERLPDGFTHSHSYTKIRPWWERLWLKLVMRREWPYWEEKEISLPCSGKVVDIGNKVKVRTEYDMMTDCWRVVAFKSYRCERPSVSWKQEVMIYANMAVPERSVHESAGRMA